MLFGIILIVMLAYSFAIINNIRKSIKNINMYKKKIIDIKNKILRQMKILWANYSFIEIGVKKDGRNKTKTYRNNKKQIRKRRNPKPTHTWDYR